MVSGVSPLPARQCSFDALSPRCPWCRDEIADLTVSAAALQAAHDAGILTGTGNWLDHARPFTGAEAECPRCGKGLLIKCVSDTGAYGPWERQIVIAPARSAKDEAWLAEQAGAV